MNLSTAILLPCFSLIIIFPPLFAKEAIPHETIPFVMVGEHIFIKAIIEGPDTLDLVFDTGASTMVLNKNLVNEKKWNFDQIATSTGVSGSTNLNLGKISFLSLGKIKLENLPVVSAPLTHLELRIGKDIDGIIGFEILDRFLVSINYKHRELRLYRRNQRKKEDWGNQIDIDLKLGIPSVWARLYLPEGEIIDGHFFIDSGAGSALILNSPFVKTHRIEEKIPYAYRSQTKGLSNTAATIIETELSQLDLGGFSVKGIPTRLSKSRLGVTAMEDYAGIIGNPILKRFTITLDYAKKNMYVREEEDYQPAFIPDFSGMTIRLNEAKDKIVIDQVIAGSPAERAGIQAGDILSMVNDMVVEAGDIHQIRKQFTGIDEEITLKLIRNQQNLTIHLWLEIWYK
jgi:hypothetical protein